MKKMILITLAVLLALTAVPLAAARAESGSTETPAAEETTATPEATAAEPTPTPDTSLSTGSEGYISTTLFGSDSYMTGLFSDVTKGFSVGDWDVLDARFTLSFSTTQLVSETLSNITISINGVRFYSETVPVTDGLRRTLTVKIPVEHIATGYNVIRIEGYIRTYNGLPCVDDVTSANWMNIFSESSIEVSYTPAAFCQTIDEFYTCFTSIDALENSQSAVAVSTGFDDDELGAAFTALAGVSSKATTDYQNIDLLAADSMMYLKDKKYVIYIAKSGNLPAEIEAAVEAGGGVAASGATLMLIPGETNVLVVAAADGAGLSKAATALGNGTLMYQLKNSVKQISADEDVLVREEGVDQYTQLTTTGTYLSGPFRQKTDYFIDFPDNRQLAYGSELELHFRYSENLDFSRSLVSVYINNVPIGSQKLSEATAGDDVLVIDIPTDIDVTGSFTLSVAFDLEIADLWCTLRQEETPWAYVSSESTLKLNSAEAPYYLFDNYPYPFISSGAFNDTVVILPDSNNDIDLTLMGDFMLTLGQYLKYNTGELSVTRASQPGDLQDKNVIVVGTPSNNAVIKALNSELFFRFNDDGVGIQSNEKLLLDSTYAASIATAQLIESPYSSLRNAILVIAGTNESDLEYALDYFGDSSKIWTLYGDGFVADSDEIFQYRFKEDNAQQEEEAQTLAERTDILYLLYIGGAILLILAVATVLIVLRYRRKQK
ncbi:MAG TPA: cellulose biosynthesis cyclic di-GMP-binding regulatory protein BcsB [Eubacteriales bacterium]|nr:cellulose biosynthesis cyclic di-GMP-binding regulatory protein BcsB [Eubacteriales bacterium]